MVHILYLPKEKAGGPTPKIASVMEKVRSAARTGAYPSGRIQREDDERHRDQ